MGKIKFDETYLFKISIRIQFFWCNYGYQNSIFRVSVTIEPDHSLYTVRHHELFDLLEPLNNSL